MSAAPLAHGTCLPVVVRMCGPALWGWPVAFVATAV